jgi:hypothetical protein
MRRGVMIVGVAGFAGMAGGQSASLELTSAQAAVSPGDTVTVTAVVSYDLAGAGGGIFGNPGLYGFGGTVSAGGSGASDVSAESAVVSGDLASGSVSVTAASPMLVRAAGGRGLLDGLGDNPADVLTFDLTVDSEAEDGEVTLSFDGAVVLGLGASLNTFSTTPGDNQGTLTVTSLVLTIGSSGCNPADLAEPFGQLTFGDISAFLGAFSANDPSADLAAPFGQFTFGDISAFLGAFSAGCP